MPRLDEVDKFYNAVNQKIILKSLFSHDRLDRSGIYGVVDNSQLIHGNFSLPPFLFGKESLMCGLLAGLNLNPAEIEIVADGIRHIAHRGPDSIGTYKSEDNRNFIGVTRLSIQDIQNGDQPIWNSDKSIAVFANCEIYNFQELNEILISKSIFLKTKSDVETILHLYEEYGLEFTKLVLGPFAIFILDLRKNLVHILRDQLGEKPLFFSNRGKGIILSSEMKTFLKLFPNQYTIRKNFVSQFLHLGLVCEEEQIFENIESVARGTFITFDLKTSKRETGKIHQYDLPAADKDFEYEALMEKYFQSSAEIVQVAETPIGLAYSGGLDSSLLAQVLNENPNCVFFYLSTKSMPKEHLENSLVGNFSEKLQDCRFEPTAISQELPFLLSRQDTPVADRAFAGYSMIARESKKRGIKVMILGHGPDELSWGYDWIDYLIKDNLRRRDYFLGNAKFHDYLQFDALRDVGGWKSLRFREVLSLIKDLFGLKSDLISLRRDKSDKEKGKFDLVYYQFGIFGKRKTSKSIKRFLTDSSSPEEKVNVDLRFLTNEQVKLEIQKELISKYLVVNGLRQLDNVFMQFSVEVRLPFLDRRIFQASQSYTHHNPNVKNKEIWRAIAKRRGLSKEATRKKMGFTIEEKQLMRELHSRHSDKLKDLLIVRDQLISPVALKTLRKPFGYFGGMTPYWYEIFVLEFWYRDVRQYLKTQTNKMKFDSQGI